MTQAKQFVPVAPVIEIAPMSPVDDNRALSDGQGTELIHQRKRMMPTEHSERTLRRFSFPLSLALLASLHTGTPAWAWAMLGHRITARLAERNLNRKARVDLQRYRSGIQRQFPSTCKRYDQRLLA
jgi:hypothetical protein